MKKLMILFSFLFIATIAIAQDQIPNTPIFIIFEKQSWDLDDVQYKPRAFTTIEDVRGYLEKTNKDDIFNRMYVSNAYYPLEFVQTIPVAREIVIEEKQEWKFLPPIQLSR